MMEILGIGPTELIFIILIAIIVLGPKDMQKAGKTIGHWLNQIRESEVWKLVSDASREVGNLPNKWMREANMEMWESQQDLRRMLDPAAKPRAAQRRPGLPPFEEQENTIGPASANSLPTPAEEKPAVDTDQHD
jgi:sec-independent protein translocase protein TatB